MTIEVASIILNAKDDMTGVEIAVTAIRSLEKRVEEWERVWKKAKDEVR